METAKVDQQISGTIRPSATNLGPREVDLYFFRSVINKKALSNEYSRLFVHPTRRILGTNIIFSPHSILNANN